MSVSIALDPKFLDSTCDISRFTPFANINDMRSVSCCMLVLCSLTVVLYGM